MIGDPYRSFKGNMMFSSKYSFMGHTLSRRDDIISILYILIFLINGRIPLDKNTMSMRQQFEKIRKLKVHNSAKKYCKGKSIHFRAILEYAYKIEFDEKPNYTYIKFLLKKILLDLNRVSMEMFNWKSK